MPRGDGTGPLGQGPRTGRGRGKGGENLQSAGLGGNCICSSCGRTVTHQAGVPCSSMICPWCSGPMVRE